MQQLRIKQKAEALKRMELLKLDKSVIRDFRKEDVIYYSERQNAIFDGILYYLNDNNEWMQKVIDFENEYEAMVYHAQLTHTTFGRCLSLLYVSRDEDEWEMDKEDLQGKAKRACAYVINLDDEWLSEIGAIGLVSKNGGVSRTY